MSLRVFQVLCFWICSAGLASQLKQSSGGELCVPVVTTLTTDFGYRTPPLSIARVEVRHCAPSDGGTLQLVAWSRNAKAPTVLINTGDFGIVQVVARQNVFVVETGGATRDQVFVITYRGGRPALSLRRVTRGNAVVQVNETELQVRISGIFVGDGPAKTEQHRFPMDADGMVP